MPVDIEALFNRLATAVYDGSLPPGAVDKAVASFTADTLMKAVFMGYGADFSNVVYDTPDAIQLAKLEQNTYYFSVAKNYQQVLELNSLLRDGDKVRTFAEFKKLALDNFDTWQSKYLLAEYKHAVSSSLMARQWVDAQAQKETHPNLRYSTVGDSHVRAEHASLNKITLPIDDPFWNTWYPPNGWGCRCMVQQVTDGTTTDITNKALPEWKKGQEMFQTNTAKDGMVYPPKHPYWDLEGNTKYELASKAKKIWRTAQEKQSKEFFVEGKIKIIHPAMDLPIGFNNTAIDELYNQPHQDYHFKNGLIRNIHHILKDAIYHGRNAYKCTAKGDYSHIFEITINQKPSYVVVKERNKAKELICYSISDSPKTLLNTTIPPKIQKPK